MLFVLPTMTKQHTSTRTSTFIIVRSGDFLYDRCVLDAFQLHCGASTVTVLPACGAALAGWWWRDKPMLFAGHGQGPQAMACFPMVPYVNRIAHGRLPGENPLPPHPGEHHSLHGVGWRRAWQVRERNAAHAVLVLRHRADPDWPFDFDAVLTIALGENWLMQTLAVTNSGTRTMPTGLGFHPFFPADRQTVLDTGWSGVWGVSADHLPTEFGPTPASGAIEVGSWHVNNCYTGWTGQALLSYPDYGMIIGANPVCSALQCYRPGEGSGFVALEPVSHIPNAHQLREAGVVDTGLRDLAPGQNLAAWMTLQIVS
ncbi:aldose 1-epimerase [Duganella sp. PWIR1]